MENLISILTHHDGCDDKGSVYERDSIELGVIGGLRQIDSSRGAPLTDLSYSKSIHQSCLDIVCTVGRQPMSCKTTAHRVHMQPRVIPGQQRVETETQIMNNLYVVYCSIVGISLVCSQLEVGTDYLCGRIYGIWSELHLWIVWHIPHVTNNNFWAMRIAQCWRICLNSIRYSGINLR